MFFVSIFKTTLVEELYNIFQDQILDQLGEIISPQKKLGSSPKLLKIQEKDFEFYMEKIKKVKGCRLVKFIGLRCLQEE